jgi:hypothetical protein
VVGRLGWVGSWVFLRTDLDRSGAWGKKKENKETHLRGQSLGLGFIPSKNEKRDFLDGALGGTVSQKLYKSRFCNN